MTTITDIQVDADREGVQVVRTDTGELLDITDLVDASPEVQAAVYGHLVKIASEVSTLRNQMKDQLERRFVEGAVHSASYYGGVKVTRSQVRKWDPKRIGVILDRLATDGIITQARADAAAPTVETRKADGKKLNQLLQELGGTDAGKDLASTKTDAVTWKAEIVDVPDVEPVPEQASEPASPVDAFFGSEAA
jgi:hypothetical protein